MRAADLVARSVMFPEPARVSELVAALRPAVPPSPPSSRPEDAGTAGAGGSDTAEPQASTVGETAGASARELPDQSAEAPQTQDDVRKEEAPRSAAAATSSSLADTIVSVCTASAVPSSPMVLLAL